MTLRGLTRGARRWASALAPTTPFAGIVVHAVLDRRRAPEERPWRRPALTAVRPGKRGRTTGLVVVSVIRNGIANGYPFVEAYGSWLAYCDRLIVLEGDSTDGTRDALAALSALDPRVEVVSHPWPADTAAGTAIAAFTQQALAVARETGADRLMYVQADEIYTATQRRLVREHRGGALEFAGCVNFWNGFDRVLENEFPLRYVRLLPAGAEATALADGYTFAVAGAPVEHTPERFLHYGWCFPGSILRKHVSHGRLYRDEPAYRVRAWLAARMLEQRRYDRRLLDALAREYRPVPFTGEHPACMAHLLPLDDYDPGPGLQLLAEGADW